VVIDAGHGGHDSGAVGHFGREKDYALDTARRLRDELDERGFKTVMTRETDVFLTLGQRAAIANAQSDAIFISIHFNSSGGRTAIGIETFALHPEEERPSDDGGGSLNTLLSGNLRISENVALATAVHAHVVRDLQSADRGVKRARFNVLRGIAMPAILFEGGFVTNRAEARVIHDPAHRQRMAESIAEAVVNFREEVGPSDSAARSHDRSRSEASQVTAGQAEEARPDANDANPQDAAPLQD